MILVGVNLKVMTIPVKLNMLKLLKRRWEWFSEFEIHTLKSVESAIQRASDLAKKLGVIHIMTSFIFDTGAGLSLRCYAKGLTTHY